MTGRPSAVAVSDGMVWVTNDRTHDLRAFDAASVEPMGRPIKTERNPIALAAAARSIWVAHAGGTVLRVDARSRRPGTPITLGGSITGIAASERRVWAADHLTSSLIEVDASADPRGVFRVRDGVVRVMIARDVVWVTNEERTVTRIDPRSRTIGPPVPVGLGPIGLAFDGERIWVANSDDDTVSRIDAQSGRRIGPPIRVGRAPIGVAVAEDVVCVVNQDDGTLVRVRASNGEVIGDPIDLRMHPRGVVADRGRVWAVGTNPSSLVRVDL
jgi:YVTN family beta-propeller protein